jgi:hypothetical protein
VAFAGLLSPDEDGDGGGVSVAAEELLGGVFTAIIIEEKPVDSASANNTIRLIIQELLWG